MTLSPLSFPGDPMLDNFTYAITVPSGTPDPSAYVFPRYALVAAFGKSEAEEVAARLITLSQRAGQWAAFRYQAFWLMVREEFGEGGDVFTTIMAELLTTTADANQAVRNVINRGARYLEERGYVRFEGEAQSGYAFDVIVPTDTFFPNIQRFATAAV